MSVSNYSPMPGSEWNALVSKRMTSYTLLISDSVPLSNRVN
jgi:hypothetical protein